MPGASQKSLTIARPRPSRAKCTISSHYDIWHGTYQNTNYLPFRNKKTKVVLSIHDLNSLYDEKKSPAKKQKYLAHVQHLIDRVDAIVCISEFSKQDVLKHCNTANKPLHTIYNGTNLLQQPERPHNHTGPKSHSSSRLALSIEKRISMFCCLY